MKIKKYIHIKVFIIFIIFTFVLGLLFGYVFFHQKVIITQENNNIYDEMMSIIEKEWIDTTNSQETLQDRLKKGMISGLGDIYSEYMTKNEANEFLNTLDSEKVGLGFEYRLVHSGILLTKVYDNTPASKVFQVGDILEDLNGVTLQKKGLDEVSKLLAGDENSRFRIKYKRYNKENYVTVIPKKITSDVSYHLQNNYGYIQIHSIGSKTQDSVENALKEFQKKNIHTLILDLRDNGGGYIDNANEILDLFHKKGSINFYLKDKNKKETVYKSLNDKAYIFDKGYVLVNKDTASSAEIIALNLQEALHYKLIGQTTYGKGIVQSRQTLKNGAVLKYTSSLWYSKNHTNIQGKGITPDIFVDMIDIESDYDILTTFYHQNQVSQDIAVMEKMLKALDYKVDRIDGYMSQSVTNAFKKFQQDYHLKSTGIYTNNDSEALLSAYYQNYVRGNKNPVIKKLEEIVKR